MQASAVARATAAATSIAASLGLAVDRTVVLHDSNKLTLRLLPCDVVARVAPAAHQVAQLEIDIAQGLAESGSPVAVPDPRIEPRPYGSDGIVTTFWTHYETAEPGAVAPGDYADSLGRLHAGMRRLDVRTPHFTDRIDEARRLVANGAATPALADADRELLGTTLGNLSRLTSRHGGAEQVLHGEPHPGNVLATTSGPRYVDLETCCRGPVEFDLAHAPEAVSDLHPGVNEDLLRACRILVLAMVTTWRWDIKDRFPNGRLSGMDGLGRLRTALDQPR